MAVTRIKNNQITDSTIDASAKILQGSIVGSLFAANITLNSNVSIVGNLAVQGNLTTISSTNTYVNDPILTLNNGYLGAPTYDVGILVNRNLNPYNVALMWRESDSAFEVFYTTETGGTYGTINQSGFANLKVGYAIASTVLGGNLQMSGDTLTSAVANGNLTLAGNGTGSVFSASALLPTTSGLSLGSLTNPWNTVYTSSNGINLNGSTITESGGSVVITPNGGTTTVANLVITGSGSTFTGNIVSGNVDITGGMINNTVIGNVTPAAGTFTVMSTANAVITGGSISGASITGSPISGSTGSFTSIIDSGSLTANGSNATISLQPTGTGTVSIAPATTGSINNMSIGATTPSTGAFTTLAASSASLTSLNATVIGNVTPAAGTFTTLTSTGLTTAASLAVNAAATVGGNLTVTGAQTTVTALAASSAVVSGNASVGGSFSVAGAAALGAMTTGNATINGGAINGTVIGATTAAAATFTTLVAGLANFAAINNTPIGNATPSTGAFTTLTSTGLSTVDSLAVNNAATFSSDVTVSGNVDVTSNAASTSTTTGAIITAGGIGVAGNVNVGGNIGLGTTTFAPGTITSTSTLALSSATGNIQLGNLSYPQTDGVASAVMVTDGAGHLSLQTFVGAGITGNTIQLGTPTDGSYTNGNPAVNTWSTTTYISDALDQLNTLVGLLVPPQPPTFPNATVLSINSLAPAGVLRMTSFTQTDHTTTSSKQLSGGTALSNYIRSASYSTNTITNVGPGYAGNVKVVLDSVTAGTHLMATGTGNNGTYGNLIISNNVDYSTITGKALGFWYSFNAQAAGTVAAGWNEVYMTDDATGAAATNTPAWYYDSSAPGTPVITTTTFAPSSNVVAYSSSVPHYTSAAGWTWTGTVNKLSGDLYPNTDTFFTGSAGGSFQAPASVTYTAAGITTPLARNLYVASGSASVTTTANIANVTGQSSVGPSFSAINSYATGSLTASPGGTVLTINTSATSPLNENSIVVTSVGTGSGNAVRIGGFSGTNTPSTASPAAWTSSSALASTDAAVVAGVLSNNTTNYSTGYFPVGPNLSGQAATQYATFRFARTAVSKFDIAFTGKVSGCWVALPGSSLDTTAAPTNGWIDATIAYAGSGLPGTGTGGNGSDGAALSGTMTTGATVTQSITVTFGTESSTNSTGNDIYVRFKLNTGDSITALQFVTATH